MRLGVVLAINVVVLVVGVVNVADRTMTPVGAVFNAVSVGCAVVGVAAVLLVLHKLRSDRDRGEGDR